MLVNEISMKQIIERRVKYIETSDKYADADMENYDKGEIEGYEEILHDGSIMSEEEFIIKYLKVLGGLKEILENDYIQDEISVDPEIERLCGYNNAIVYILKLFNPIYISDDELCNHIKIVSS